MDWNEILKEVLQTYDDTVSNDYDLKISSESNNYWLLVTDWDTISKLNSISKDVLLKHNYNIKDDAPTESKEHFLDIILNELNIEFVFSDEYIVCDNCNRIVPIKGAFSEDNYIRDENDDIICGECIRKNPKWYIEEYMLSNPVNNINEYLDDKILESFGFELVKTVNEDDIPQIFNELKTNANQVIFSNNTQEFEVFVREH